MDIKSFLQKHGLKLRTLSLVIMILIPFLLYFSVRYGAPWQVKWLLGLMALTMAAVIKID